MTTENENQVGGRHYQSEFMHWDLIELSGIGYLEGIATKYLVRIGRKGEGVQDLQKAKHCVNKLIELSMEGVRSPRGDVDPHVMQEFCEVNKIESPLMRTCLSVLCSRWTVGKLHHVVSVIDLMIESWPSQQRHIDKTGQEHPFGYDASEEG
jgi:hypothetical protein